MRREQGDKIKEDEMGEACSTYGGFQIRKKVSLKS
jgi:hypothetical protein